VRHALAHFHRDERGATLILAIGLVIVLGALSGGLLPFITSGLKDRTVLDGVRNRQYSADGAVEYSIARVRSISGVGLVSCGGPDVRTLDGVTVRVDCTNAPTVTFSGYLQRNVIFTACVNTGVACTDPSVTPVVRAQVNFESAGTGISRTWIQAWSVNQ
jgi:hypothetical protein